MSIQDLINEYEQAEQAEEQAEETRLAGLRQEARAAMVNAVRLLGLDDELVPVGETRVDGRTGIGTQRIAHTSWSRELGNKVPGVYLHYLPQNKAMVLVSEEHAHYQNGVPVATEGRLWPELDRRQLGRLLKGAQQAYQTAVQQARNQRIENLTYRLKHRLANWNENRQEALDIEADLKRLAPGRAAEWTALREEWEAETAAREARHAAWAQARADYLEAYKAFLRLVGAENRYVRGELNALQGQLDKTFQLHPLEYAVINAEDPSLASTETIHVTADTPDASGYYTMVSRYDGRRTPIRVANLVAIYGAETFKVTDFGFTRRLDFGREGERSVTHRVYCLEEDEAAVEVRFAELRLRAWPPSPSRPAELSGYEASEVEDAALKAVKEEDPTLVF